MVRDGPRHGLLIPTESYETLMYVDECLIVHQGNTSDVFTDYIRERVVPEIILGRMSFKSFYGRKVP